MFTKKYCSIVRLTLILVTIIISALPATEAAASFSVDFKHLLELTTDTTKQFDINKIEKILAFVSSEEYLKTPEYSGGLINTPSAYYGHSLNSSMEQVLQLCYNTKIPACAILPESIRLTEWSKKEPTELWKQLNNLKKDIVIKGSLYLQSTPDTTTGAYYGYNSLSTSILFKYKGRNAYLSISKQKDISEVGKKGFVLGDYNDLNYFYSGKTGLNKFGLGGIKSYLYDGFAVSVYIESENNKKDIHCGTFKWLKGGWGGLNIIRKKHIYNGLKRFADSQKALFESGRFPEYDKLVSICSNYALLSEKEMKKMMGRYLLNLQQEWNSGGSRPCPDILKKGFNPDKYIDTMSKEEMRSALIVEKIKFLIHNTTHQKERIISFNN